MNSYKQRNFDSHLECYRIDNIPDRDYEADSNLMHDRNRGVTHFYLLQEGCAPRIISDVEIAFSPDLSVTSLFSYEHRERLAHRVVSSHRPNGMTDEVLADIVPGNSSYERSEVSRMGRDMFKSISALAKPSVADPPESNTPAADKTD